QRIIGLDAQRPLERRGCSRQVAMRGLRICLRDERAGGGRERTLVRRRCRRTRRQRRKRRRRRQRGLRRRRRCWLRRRRHGGAEQRTAGGERGGGEQNRACSQGSVCLNHALILSPSDSGGEGPQPGLPGSTVPFGTATTTASALQSGVVSRPSSNPIQRSSTSSGGTGWNEADFRLAMVSTHTGNAPAAPVRPVTRLSS